jgi:hypothetical protein
MWSLGFAVGSNGSYNGQNIPISSERSSSALANGSFPILPDPSTRRTRSRGSVGGRTNCVPNFSDVEVSVIAVENITQNLLCIIIRTRCMTKNSILQIQ